jgi:ribonuclease R
LTYNQVGTILEEPDSSDGIQLCEDFAELLPELHELYGLYQVLVSRRKKRGAIDFETVETQIVFGDERKIDAIVPTERNDAHKIIEECMLCANVATAEFLSRHKLPSLYRIHEGPTAQKLENVRSFLGEQGLQLMGGLDPSPADYQQIMSEIKDRPDFSVLQTVLLRSMSQAIYGPEEKGHFGLAYEHYAHFTSPIRRYPDLLVHRAIKSIIYSGKANDFDDVLVAQNADLSVQCKAYRYPYDLAKMLVLGEHCSMAERRADEATRDVMSWLKCEYLQQHLGEEFEGIISAVTGFGFFVELADLYAEGLVHVSTLDSDYYQFDAAKHRLIGERSGKRFGLGDKVVVQVSNINLEERKVDLLLVRSASNRRGTLKLKNVDKAKGPDRTKGSRKYKDSDKPKVKSRNSARKKIGRASKGKAKKMPGSKVVDGRLEQAVELESHQTKKRKPSKLEALKSKKVKKPLKKSSKTKAEKGTDAQPIKIRKRKVKTKG